MKFFLIGLPGSGKTTLGQQLAEKLHLPFIDLDAEIEKKEGESVQTIFAQKGEEYFRRRETEVLKPLIQNQVSFVMATGGGTPCFFNNMELMNQSGKTIFLDMPASEITLRLQQTNLNERPLFARLSTEQLKDKIEFLRTHRLPFYKQAQFVFSIKEISPEEIIEKIKV